MVAWILDNIGPDVPLHFTAFHPDYRMVNEPRTPSSTLENAREIALREGLNFVYTGNVHDKSGSSTYCKNCDKILIGRDWYVLSDWNLDNKGNCNFCGTPCPGNFEGPAGNWGARRQPVRIGGF